MAQVVTPLAVLPDGSFALYADPVSWRVMRVLATTSTAEDIAVPATAKYAVFAATGDFAALYKTTATGGPAASFADTTDGTAPEINPTLRFIKDTCRQISLIGKTSNVAVGVTFYSA